MIALDREAIAALRTEELDWRHRWVPPDWYGRTAADAIGARLSDLDGPVPALDRAALDHNLRAMAGWCERAGVSLAPHGKTTMAPQLIAEQIAHGAWGVTVASLAQARVLRAFGVSPIVVANEVVDVAGLRWVVREQRADPSFRLLCWVDSTAGVTLLDEALAESPRPVDVLVEVGVPGGRTGCRTNAAAEEVARAAAVAPHLRLVGVCGYEGILPRPADADRFLGTMVDVARRLEPWFDVDEVILSAGGSAYFDRVVAALPGALDRPTRTVIRSGCYLTHDAGHYAGMTPAARGVAGAPAFRDALRVWVRIVSRPEPGLALLAAGRRDLPYDQGLPIPMDRPGWRVTALNDQHAYVEIPRDADLRIGDAVPLGISHPCSLFDRWTLLPIVDGDSIVDLVRTFF